VIFDDIDASLLGSVEVLRDASKAFPPPAHALRERSGALCANFRCPTARPCPWPTSEASVREIAQILHLPLAPSCHDCFRGRRLLRAYLRDVRDPSGLAQMICAST